MRERERDGRWWLGDDEESDRDSELVSMSTHLSAAALSSLPPQARVLSHTLFCPNSRPAPSPAAPIVAQIRARHWVSIRIVAAAPGEQIFCVDASQDKENQSAFGRRLRVARDRALAGVRTRRVPGSGHGSGVGGRLEVVQVKFSGRFEAHVGDPSGRVYWHRDPARRHLHAPSLSRALSSSRPPSPSHAPVTGPRAASLSLLPLVKVCSFASMSTAPRASITPAPVASGASSLILPSLPGPISHALPCRFFPRGSAPPVFQAVPRRDGHSCHVQLSPARPG